MEGSSGIFRKEVRDKKDKGYKQEFCLRGILVLQRVRKIDGRTVWEYSFWGDFEEILNGVEDKGNRSYFF